MSTQSPTDSAAEPPFDFAMVRGRFTWPIAWYTVNVEPVSYFVRMKAKPGKAEQVLELLLSNPRRIEDGEAGNLVFGVHRSVDDPNEFWLYETWESSAAVEAHESGDAFRDYKQQLRPLVDDDSLVFGNCTPVKVLGYSITR